ncbi:MAG: SAM-dependent chlorinase/fluorinase [Ferruginibacter sp.]
MPLITLTSDIGQQDFITGAVKGKLLQTNTSFNIVDITHELSPFNYPQAAYVCRSARIIHQEGLPSDIVNGDGSSSKVTYSYTQTAITDTGNIQDTTDPFVSSINPKGTDGIWMTADDGLELKSSNATVNSGNNKPNTLKTDIAGQLRIFNTTIDMGAYEYQALPDGTNLALNKDSVTKILFPGVNGLLIRG